MRKEHRSDGSHACIRNVAEYRGQRDIHPIPHRDVKVSIGTFQHVTAHSAAQLFRRKDGRGRPQRVTADDHRAARPARFQKVDRSPNILPRSPADVVIFAAGIAVSTQSHHQHRISVRNQQLGTIERVTAISVVAVK
jgi:hypothetical protein